MSKSTLTAFLSQNAKKVENKKIVVSERFVNPETGEPVEWEAKAISATEIKKLRQSVTKDYPMPGGKKGQFIQRTDSAEFQLKLAVKCTVYPDLDNQELQDSYGVMGAEALLGAMLTGGEYDDYTAAINTLCGYKLDNNEMVEEAKN